jgi:hypothetical protein
VAYNFYPSWGKPLPFNFSNPASLCNHFNSFLAHKVQQHFSHGKKTQMTYQHSARPVMLETVVAGWDVTVVSTWNIDNDKIVCTADGATKWAELNSKYFHLTQLWPMTYDAACMLPSSCDQAVEQIGKCECRQDLSKRGNMDSYALI